MAGEFEEFSFDDIEKVAAASPISPSIVVSKSDRLQYLIDNTPAIIYTSVPTGDFKMTFVSGNAYHVLGYHPEEMISDPNFWFDHIHPEDVPQIFSSLAMLFSEGHRTYEYRFMSQSGNYVWMHDKLHLVRDENGNPLEVVGSLTDITERKQMEGDLQKKSEDQKILIDKLQEAQEQLVQSEKMASVGQLAAGIAHEINNPVGFVNSNMGTLKNYVTTLFEVLDESDDECALRDENPGRPCDDGGGLFREGQLEVQFGGEGGYVELFQGLGDAFRLRTGEASLFELLHDAVRVDHERLHMRSV